MTATAPTDRSSAATGRGSRAAVICAAARVDGGSGAESADRLSARFARPIPGARYLNRATRLAVLAVDALGLARSASMAEAEGLGVVAATFGAHFEQNGRQLTELSTSERPLVSPMLGPNSIPSSVSSCLAIYLDARAFTLTFCDSGTAGVEALRFAARAISSGRAKRVAVVGVESRPAAIERALLGASSDPPPDEATAFLVGDPADRPRSVRRSVLVAAQARAFGGAGPGARRRAVQRCLLEVAERARERAVPVDLVAGDLERAALLPDGDLMSLAPNLEAAHWFEDRGRNPGLQCTAGLAQVASVHLLVESGRLPDGLVTLRQGGRALDQVRGAILVNGCSDGTIACTLLQVEAGDAP
jgi:hypothetical protein